MNETLGTIARRYSCRSYTDERLTEEQLNAIAQAAIQAPSAVNRQPWHISVVTQPELLAELEAEGESMLQKRDPATYARILGRVGKLFYNAPCMVIIAVKPADLAGAEQVDLGIAAQNVALAATALGLDNVHCGLTAFCFAGEKREEFKKRLAFPEGYECGIGVLIGHGTASGTPHTPDESKITYIR